MKPSTRLFLARRKQGFWGLMMFLTRPFTKAYRFASREEIDAINEQTGILISMVKRERSQATTAPCNETEAP